MGFVGEGCGRREGGGVNRQKSDGRRGYSEKKGGSWEEEGKRRETSKGVIMLHISEIMKFAF